jgi:carboxylesterase type B
VYNAANPYPGAPPIPTDDGNFYTSSQPNRFAFDDGHGKMAVMIGDVGNEQALWNFVATQVPKPPTPPTVASIIGAITGVIGQSKASAMFATYKLSATIVPTKARPIFLQIFSDITTYLPDSTFASNFTKAGGTVYPYAFDQVNPFPGPFFGTANHAIELPYLFNNGTLFHGTANPSQEAAISNAIRDKWIVFANGGAPWTAGKTYAFGPKGITGELTARQLAQRRNIAQFEVLKTLSFGEQSAVGGLAASYFFQTS